MHAKKEPPDVVLPPAPAPTAAELEAREKDRKAALKSLTDRRRAAAWQLHRWPLTKHTVWGRTKVHLPRTYLATDGADVLPVYAGADLNQLVHAHYLQTVDAPRAGWVNYVHADSVVARRHEFLGPDPRVAGYVVDIDGEIHIRWWDEFLNDQWIDKQKWKVSVTLNDEGKWVEKDD